MRTGPIVRPGSRIETAQAKLREYLTDVPNATLNQALRWLNNQRVAGQKLTLMPGEARFVFDQMRNPAVGQKALPIEVKPSDVREPLRVPLALLAHPPPAQPTDIPTVPAAPALMVPPEVALRAAKIRMVDDLALEHPQWTQAEIATRLKEKFGSSISGSLIQEALEQARHAAGMPINFRHPALQLGEHQTRSGPKKKEPMPDLVKPADAADPNDLLKGAGLKLKHLCASMKWSQVVMTVKADGSISYDATPAPVMAMKGEIKL